MKDTVNPSALIQELAMSSKLSTNEALTLCDALPIVTIETIIGRWRGVGIATGHPLDGMLETFGWYGKEFIDRDHVRPLLFSGHGGKLFSLDPQRLPLGLALKISLPQNKLTRQLFLATSVVLQTRKAKARVRMLEYRGKVSATMIYDNLPIYDTFRLINQDTLLGVMDLKGVAQPFFFKLLRDG